MKIPLLLLLTFFSAVRLAHALEVHSSSSGFEWTIETTRGLQQHLNTMTKEDGGSAQLSQTLFFSGLLFHAFYERDMFAKMQMNLGFAKSVPFSWSDTPDFNHDGSFLNENLKSIEIDVQVFPPALMFASARFFPFFGYSFAHYSYDDAYSKNEITFSYNSLSAGIQYFNRITKRLFTALYVSYSPMFPAAQRLISRDVLHCLNYGGEISVFIRPVAFIFFVAQKAELSNFNAALVRITNSGSRTFRFNTVEVGFCIHLQL